MGISHRAEPSIGCTFDVWDGEVSDDDLCHHLVRLAEDSSWPAGHAHLTDLTTLVSAPVPDPQVLDALYDGTSLGRDLRVAVVVPVTLAPDTDLMYATVTEQLSAQTFPDLAHACAYLGVDEARARVALDEVRRSLPLTEARG